MDLLSMLMTAKVLDTDGRDVGEVLAVGFMAGKMVITLAVDDEEDEEVDPDDGEEITPEERGKLHLIRPIEEPLKGGSHG